MKSIMSVRALKLLLGQACLGLVDITTPEDRRAEIQNKYEHRRQIQKLYVFDSAEFVVAHKFTFFDLPVMKKNYTEADLKEIARWLLAEATSKTLCFYGEMGAGKTTLIKELVRRLEGSEPGNSPTFGIVNEYQKTNGDLLGYHFDFYRLNDEMEAYDLGFEDYLAQNTWVFIEWPEKFKVC